MAGDGALEDGAADREIDDVVRVTGLRLVLDDGVTLVADAWHPANDRAGPWPVLLQRLPYGRSVASTPVLPHPSWFARRGYAVLVQDCRGRGDSTGVFSPFVDEGRDGAATIEWAARLPICDGRVATYGFSYQGLAQLYAAARRPPSLRAIAPMMCCPDPGDGWTYEGGLLRWQFVCFWAAQLAGQELRTGPVPFDVHVLPRSSALGPNPPPWFAEWLAHLPVSLRADSAAESARKNHYWADRRPDLSAIQVPAFTVGGWFDDFSSGTAALIEQLNAEAIFGPWAHMPWGPVHGGVDLGPAAAPAPVADALIGFFDRVFGLTHPPRATSVRADAPPQPPASRFDQRVRYFVLGSGVWRTASAWPPSQSELQYWTAWSPSGNANSRSGDGRLARSGARPRNHPASVIVAQPLVPYPGEALEFQDESSSEDRRDVLCFTSEPLTEPLTIVGAPTVIVSTRCDRPSHDVVAVLTVVDHRGGSRALTGWATRVGPTDVKRQNTGPTTVELRLRPIAVELNPGDRLRLDVSGARFPCYDRNPHTLDGSPDTPAAEHLVATIEVWGAELHLPVVGSGDAERTRA